MAKAEKEEIPTIPLAKLKGKKADRAELSRLCIEKREIADAIRQSKRDEKALMKGIKPIADRLGVEKVLGDGFIIQKFKGGVGTEISATKLLELGVPMTKIKAATVEKQGYTYYKVLAADGGDDEE